MLLGRGKGLSLAGTDVMLCGIHWQDKAIRILSGESEARAIEPT